MLRYLLLIWLIIIICLLAKSGSAEYLYHGSSKKIAVLEPRPSGVLSGESVVFATDYYIDAVVFAVGWTDYNFGFGTSGGKKYLSEKYSGAFAKLATNGYIHYVSPAGFHKDDRLMPSENICENPVKVLQVVKVNCLTEIKKSKELTLLKFTDDYKIKKIPNIGYKKIYIPIDIYWRPNIEADFHRHIRDANDCQNSILVADVICEYKKTIKIYNNVEVFVIMPAKIKYYGTVKTTEEEYFKYIEARKKILSNFPIIII